jgi:predicted amidohydrolase
MYQVVGLIYMFMHFLILIRTATKSTKSDKQGVTTIVDAGSCGSDRIADLVSSREHARTNVFAFLNISRIGLKRVDELSNLEWIDQEKALQAARAYKGVIVGLKARISRSVVGDSIIEPLHCASTFYSNIIAVNGSYWFGTAEHRGDYSTVAKKDVVPTISMEKKIIYSMIQVNRFKCSRML